MPALQFTSLASRFDETKDAAELVPTEARSWDLRAALAPASLPAKVDVPPKVWELLADHDERVEHYERRDGEEV